MDYNHIATTVFTPIEYGAVGLSEEKAIEKFGKENIVVYHAAFKALEWSFNMGKEDDYCYIKVIVDKKDNERVVGFHIFSPNAGEITQVIIRFNNILLQGISIAMNCGLTKHILDKTIGIHPTVAEVIYFHIYFIQMVTSVDTDKSQGDGKKSAC